MPRSRNLRPKNEIDNLINSIVVGRVGEPTPLRCIRVVNYAEVMLREWLTSTRPQEAAIASEPSGPCLRLHWLFRLISVVHRHVILAVESHRAPAVRIEIRPLEFLFLAVYDRRS